jgi:hypothetical protein
MLDLECGTNQFSAESSVGTVSCPGFDINPSMASIVNRNLGLESLGRSLESILNIMDFVVPFVLGVMVIEVECNLILC